MTIPEIYHQFIEGLRHTTLPEFIAVVLGIASVWFARKEHVYVYPTGLVNTIIYIYLSFKNHLAGEAVVNLYYTIMNIYGWWLWLRKSNGEDVVKISFSSKKEWLQQLLFFSLFYAGFYFSLLYLKKNFWPAAIPSLDAAASAAAFTGMWLMTRKKVESWYWWIATNVLAMPLYFVKGMVFTSVYYFILFIIAIGGLIAWQKKAKQPHTHA